MHSNIGLRIFSKITCFSTLFLIFAGGMVTSTGSGLAVPDWPLSYGMLFPPMVGGVFYEHGHRMIASFVGLLTLILAIWLGMKEPRKWVKILGYCALCAVICQGILGGITVMFYLPTPVSVSHGVLAQTFFILTIIIAYSQSNERNNASAENRRSPKSFLQLLLLFTFIIYLQLIFGAIMRHTGSGLAIPDFPTMGGKWLPTFDKKMLITINSWRFDHDLDPITMGQILYHFLHRIGALIITIVICFLNFVGLKYYHKKTQVFKTLMLLNLFIVGQILLGITTVLTQKGPIITSLHVANGAAILGISILLILRTAPLSFKEFKTNIFP